MIPFHFLGQSSFTSGAFAAPLNPASLSGSSSKLAAEADAWAHFRVRDLRFRLHPSSVNNSQAMGFVGGVQDTPPATIGAVGELISSTFVDSSQTVPSEWVRVAPSEYSGPLPWYKTVQGSADATEESPGSFVLAGAGTDAFVFEVRGVMEFKTAVATANTPEAVALLKRFRQIRLSQEQARERDALLKVLASSPSVVSGALVTSQSK